MTVDDVINYGDSLLVIGKTHGLPLRARMVGGAADRLQAGRGIEARLGAGRRARASAPTCRTRRSRYEEPSAMLMTGQDYLESIRDGRRVYVGGELVEDVTAHPAFRNAAHSFAMIYDRKRAPENRDVMTFEEDGETFSSYFLLPRTREDLQRRFETHRRIASWTHGLLGRSPDNFPSYVSGLVMDPAMFDRIRQGFGDNIRNYYRHMRANDVFASHTVTNPQGWRATAAAEGAQRPSPTLRVVAEDDRGVTINGLKMLGTASVFCHETWCGNLQPVAPGQEKEFDHLRSAPECTRREHLVAQVLRALRRERVRQSPRHPLRRDRQRRAVRECEGAVGARVLPRQRRDDARDLHAHAGPRDGQPPGQCALSGEAQPDRRRRGQARGDEQRPAHPGGAVHARPARGAAGDAGRPDHGPDQLRRGRRLPAITRSTVATSTPRCIGAPITTPRFATPCAS